LSFWFFNQRFVADAVYRSEQLMDKGLFDRFGVDFTSTPFYECPDDKDCILV
jgi:hypothetical protein